MTPAAAAASTSAANHRRVADARDRNRGFALLLVIWVLGLLAVLAAAVAADSHSEALIARHRIDLAAARGIADAGITLGVTGLFSAEPATRWPADGTAQNVEYGGGTIAVRIVDEGGKIDLNNAPTELIAGLLDEFGVDPDQRTRITNAIAERRQSFTGARTSLRVPGRFYANPNSAWTDNLNQLAFADISELRLMPGMTRGIYDRVHDYFTTYSQSQTVNPMAAARETLLAVPGIASQDVDFFLAARATSADRLAAPQLPTSAQRYLRPADLRVATITAEAKLGSRAAYTREAVVAVSPDLPDQPIRVLQWRQPIGAVPAQEQSLQ